MSADNFYVVQPWQDRFAVTMEFASDEHERTPRDLDRAVHAGHARLFDTPEEALDYAASQYAEYGVVNLIPDAKASGLLALLRRLAENEQTYITQDQGGYSHTCVVCGGGSYLGPLNHKRDCAWVAARRVTNLPFPFDTTDHRGLVVRHRLDDA